MNNKEEIPSPCMSTVSSFCGKHFSYNWEHGSGGRGWVKEDREVNAKRYRYKKTNVPKKIIVRNKEMEEKFPNNPGTIIS